MHLLSDQSCNLLYAFVFVLLKILGSSRWHIFCAMALHSHVLWPQATLGKHRVYNWLWKVTDTQHGYTQCHLETQFAEDRSLELVLEALAISKWNQSFKHLRTCLIFSICHRLQRRVKVQKFEVMTSKKCTGILAKEENIIMVSVFRCYFYI